MQLKTKITCCQHKWERGRLARNHKHMRPGRSRSQQTTKLLFGIGFELGLLFLKQFVVLSS